MNINLNNYEAYFLDYHEGNLSPQQVADLFLFLSQHPELKKEFEDFEHIVLEDFSAPVFKNKDRLKKNITPENREDYFIRAVEGTLDTTELALLHNFLSAHPEFLAEFNQFQKTKLQADAAIVFENKIILKQGIAINDDQLIAAIEGLLTEEEQALFEQQLAVNSQMQKSFVAYQQTKIAADINIIFKDKQALKRKERKVVPIYYYVAVAASLTLLLGILSLLKINSTSNTDDQRLAAQKMQPVIEQQEMVNPVVTTPEKKTNALLHINAQVLVAAQNKKHAVKKLLPEIDPANNITDATIKLTNTEELPVAEHVVASTAITPEKQNPVIVKTDSVHLPSNKNTTPVIAQIEKREAKPAFPSVGDLISSKLKEKLIGKDAGKTEKISPSNKLTGWDIAGLFAKGLSKITGKKVEVKPQFNEQGAVTAYALSAGKLEFSRGRLK
jgi:hypothetical protein